MKMLVSSSARCEVERITAILGRACIAYEVRNLDFPTDMSGIPFYPEVWVRNDKDLALAATLVAGHQYHDRPTFPSESRRVPA
jgi:hypothetical protein